MEEKTNVKKLALIVVGVLVVILAAILAISKVTMVSDDSETDVEEVVTDDATSEDNEPEASETSSSETPETDVTEELNQADIEGEDSVDINPEDYPELRALDEAETDFEAVRVEEPETKGSFEAGGFIVEKYVLQFDEQYQYVLDIRLTNDSGSLNTQYFVTKSAYDNVNEGDIFNVSYASTSEGGIAIESIM